MADFLLELRSEEIPARMQARARNDLARLFKECTGDAGLETGAIDIHSTPRRLVLIARDVAEASQAAREEIKGPRINAPAQALEGFLKKTGLKRDQLEERDGVLFALIERAGRPAGEILAETVKRIVTDFPWPKSMRWSDGSLRWVRPLHGIVAILGEDIVPVEIDGIASGATTVGHRFHHPGPITVGGASDYVEKLRACHVIVDQDERERLIREGATDAAKNAGLTLLEDEGLVVENAGLTEWPVPLIGRFDEDFLDVPREVIVLTMRTNQKYFACTASDGGLAPAFVCIANVAAKDGGEAIVEGNRRVLAARLADARFFWEHDLQVPLEDFLPKLEQMLFYEGMGSLRARADRIANLAKSICERWFPKRDPETAYRAGLLAKADLATAMVSEFPELQGVMGGYYAEYRGEKPDVVSALSQQYQQTVEGCIPACVALADRLDTLAYFFAKRLKPTGSKDPFALRRNAIGVISTIVRGGLRIPLKTALRDALPRPDTEDLDAFEKVYWQTEEPEKVIDQVLQDLLDFFADRLKVQQRDAGVRHDLIDAVFSLGGEDDLVRLLARVNALQEFVETDDGADLTTAYKRAANILKKEKWEGTAASGGSNREQQEKSLIAALDKAEPKASKAVEKEDFTGAMAALASLRRPIDDFFDHVTVNDPDPAKRERRLNLLMRFRDAVNRVADFSKIEG